MANFNYRSQFLSSYCGQQVALYAKINIGSTGACTLVSGTGMGIASITRNATGAYTLALTNTFSQLLNVEIQIKSGTSAPAAANVNIVTDAVATAAAPLVKFQMRNNSGTATDPASGEVLYITLRMDRSSVGH